MGEQAVAKFIQICASQDDLFALDEKGNIYQYNFNTKTWVKLVASRSDEESNTGNGDRRAVAEGVLPGRRS